MLTSKTMKMLGSTEKICDEDKDSENVPKLESAEVVLVRCNLVKNDYQHISNVLAILTVNKYFTTFFNNDEQLILNFLLLKFGLQIK